MACNNNLVFISCEYSGIGFTSKAVPEDATRIQLMKGHGKTSPQLQKDHTFTLPLRDVILAVRQCVLLVLMVMY